MLSLSKTFKRYSAPLWCLGFVIHILINSACSKRIIDDTTPDNHALSTSNDFILKDGEPFEIRGVVYVPGYPGYLPWDIEQSTSLPPRLTASIDQDIANIKAMGANTIRFWGAPRYCYEALKEVGELYLIQTIWIDSEQSDYQDAEFKEETKAYIRSIIDRIYSVFTDHNPPLLAYLAGNELSEASIHSTNVGHPDITGYSGNYVSTDSHMTATEAFLAEMADYIKTYEMDNYGNLPLVSYANDIRTADLIDTPFLDFRSHNTYSYAVPYYRSSTAPGSSTGTMFQGWIEQLKAKYPDVPLLITETGLSVAPNAPHIGPPNYGYGGNTTLEQAQGILLNLQDIATADQSVAGVCIHEYLDAWWKFGEEDSYSQDSNDVEEWFGMVRLYRSGNWYETAFREVYHAVKQEWTSTSDN